MTKRPKLRATLIVILCFLGALFLTARTFLPFAAVGKLPTDSMAPTIRSNTLILIESFTYTLRDPRRGEIVSHLSDGNDGGPKGIKHIKRVIALPNEHLLLSNGLVLINAQPVTITNQFGRLSFPAPPQTLLAYTNLTLRSNQYFLIGDNALISYDSRLHGPVDRTNIIGRVAAR